MEFKFDIQRHSDSGFLMDNLKGFVPKMQSDEIIRATVRGSSVLRLSKVEVMTSDNKTFPLMTQGPGAYWVAEAGRIRTDLAVEGLLTFPEKFYCNNKCCTSNAENTKTRMAAYSQ